jgi:YidC/Oxa1 family membrane protein insertase
MAYLFKTVFYQPILNLLIFFYNIIPGHDLGLAIILLTIAIKFILYPLSKQSIKSQKALTDIQPKIEELKKKHANKKEDLARATMQLYKNNKVNPLSSCLPLLIQLPFLFAVFQVFRDFGNNGDILNYVYSFIARPENINSFGLFGLLDLSGPSRVLAVLAGAAQFWQTKMLSTKRPPVKTAGAKDEDFAAIMNKQMLYMMPVLTVVIGFSLPGGLSLYWFISTLLTVIQQFYMFKKKDNKVIEGEIVKK